MIYCPNPPYWANGTWCGWGGAIANMTNSTDPISATVGTAFNVLPIIPAIFLGSLYVFLWVKFARSPGRFKLVAISALVFSISVVMAAGGLGVQALLNFVVFVAAYFISLLFRG